MAAAPRLSPRSPHSATGGCWIRESWISERRAWTSFSSTGASPFKGKVSSGMSTPTTTPNRSGTRSEEHTSELQSRLHLVCRLLLEKKKKTTLNTPNTIQYNVNYHKDNTHMSP